ncbi:MAG: hypothetical protein V4525_00330 [Pseudomonadota bacterium]
MRKPFSIPDKPFSAVPLWVGFFSLAIFLGVLSYSIQQKWHPYVISWCASLSILLPCLFYEAYASRHTITIRQENYVKHGHRMLLKRIGLSITIAIWFFLIWLFPYYREPATHLINVATYPATVWWKLSGTGTLLQWQLGVGFAAFILIDRYLKYTDLCLLTPQDGLFSFGAFILKKKEDIDYKALKQYSLQWLVKAFFLPWMLLWVNNNFQVLVNYSWSHLYSLYKNPQISLTRFILLEWEIARTLLYTIDLGFATAGYACTLKLFNTHIRSVQSTVWGWVVCLACYPPFEQMITASFMNYHGVETRFLSMWSGTPLIISALWIIGALSLLSIYTLATIQFGIRFSNLTHRGILTNGVYALSKHPAYISKNLMWWWICVPFFVVGQGWSQALGDCIRLALRNFIYYLRAKSEELHLSEDLIYREYAQWVNQYGLLARIKYYFTKLF